MRINFHENQISFSDSTLRFSERIYNNYENVSFPSRYCTCVDYGWDRDMWVAWDSTGETHEVRLKEHAINEKD